VKAPSPSTVQGSKNGEVRLKTPLPSQRRVKAPVLLHGRCARPTHDRRNFHALRPQLHHFGSQQHDPAVQFHCLVVDSNLAQALDGRDDPMLREILASSVEQLEKALCSACVAILSAKDAARLQALDCSNHPYVAWLTRRELASRACDFESMYPWKKETAPESSGRERMTSSIYRTSQHQSGSIRGRCADP
jgi:hypothetical protein